MALPEDSKAVTSQRLQQVRESYATDLTATVENCRWLATLVLAEMAGVAAYRTNVTKKETLGPGFAVIIIILGLSLAAFVLSVFVARFERRSFDSEFGGLIIEISNLATTLAEDKTVSPADGALRLIAEREAGIKSLPGALGNAGWLELGGLAFLGVGSCFAAVVVFLGEILALLGLR